MKKLVGVFATIAMLGTGTALANNDGNKPKDSSAAQGGSGQVGQSEIQQDTTIGRGTTTTPTAPGQGGSGTMGQKAPMGQKELNGRVVKAESDKIFVDMHGAVVPLEVDRSTRFSDPTLKKAKDLRPGQEIRASYEVKETKNVAKSISLSGTGGAGDPTLTPDSSINQDNNKGGSGMEQHEGTGGAGDSSTMNPDTGSNTSPDTY